MRFRKLRKDNILLAGVSVILLSTTILATANITSKIFALNVDNTDTYQKQDYAETIVSAGYSPDTKDAIARDYQDAEDYLSYLESTRNEVNSVNAILNNSMFKTGEYLDKQMNEVILKELDREAKAREAEKRAQLNIAKNAVDWNDLNKISGYTENDFKYMLRNTNMLYLAPALVKVEKEGVNGVYFAALTALESGWGKSAIARNKNNLWGYGAADSNPYGLAHSYSSITEGAVTVARNIKADYLTQGGKYYNSPSIYGVNVRYSSDPQWAWKIVNIASRWSN